jgi:hypothetical protein
MGIGFDYPLKKIYLKWEIKITVGTLIHVIFSLVFFIVAVLIIC